MSKPVYSLLSQLNIELDTLNRELYNIKYPSVDNHTTLSDSDYNFLICYFQTREMRYLDNEELDNYREQIEHRAKSEGLLLGAVEKAVWSALDSQQQMWLLSIRGPRRRQIMDTLRVAFVFRTKSFRETVLGGTINQLLKIDDSKQRFFTIEDVTDSYDFYLDKFLNKHKLIDEIGTIERLFYFKWIVKYGLEFWSFRYLYPKASLFGLAYSEETFDQIYNWYKLWRQKSKEEIMQEEETARHHLIDAKRPIIRRKICPDEETAIMSALKNGNGDAFGFD